MARADKARAVIRRRQLIKELGGVCVWCGSTHRLEIDHINGRDWNVRTTGSDQRVFRYIQEAKLGLLQVLCKRCNRVKQAGGTRETVLLLSAARREKCNRTSAESTPAKTAVS